MIMMMIIMMTKYCCISTTTTASQDADKKVLLALSLTPLVLMMVMIRTSTITTKIMSEKATMNKLDLLKVDESFGILLDLDLEKFRNCLVFN